mmetsp:Transcript_313/g.698  ORF Transcript_313/g.698 Transcript_313/m.698 type:complete len:339 (+) Transcript_313:115-1131(+)
MIQIRYLLGILLVASQCNLAHAGDDLLRVRMPEQELISDHDVSTATSNNGNRASHEKSAAHASTASAMSVNDEVSLMLKQYRESIDPASSSSKPDSPMTTTTSHQHQHQTQQQHSKREQRFRNRRAFGNSRTASSNSKRRTGGALLRRKGNTGDRHTAGNDSPANTHRVLPSDESVDSKHGAKHSKNSQGSLSVGQLTTQNQSAKSIKTTNRQETTAKSTKGIDDGDRDGNEESITIGTKNTKTSRGVDNTSDDLFDLSDCNAYSFIWITDLAATCDQDLQGCECTTAQQLFNQGFIECPVGDALFNPRRTCPVQCAVCQFCLVSGLGCSTPVVLQES